MIGSFFRKIGVFQVVVGVLATVSVISRSWVAEDAYITFRMVENLYQGNGLVFNIGERVEAFTHPLWMMVMVLIRGMEFSLPYGTLVGGILFSLGGIYLLLEKRSGNPGFTFPLAALALLTHSGFRDFSSSGMEFSLVFLLLVVFYLDREKFQFKDRPVSFSTILSLLYLTRPELSLLYLISSIFFFYEVFRSGNTETILRKSFAWVIPGLMLIGSYHIFRWFYYEDIFPNTYYAKSGLGSYFTQGWVYLKHTLKWSPSLWIPLFIFAMFPFLARWSNLKDRDRRYYFFDLAALITLTLYVTKVGGDFMAFRFLLPEIAILALAADRLLQLLLIHGARVPFPPFLSSEENRLANPAAWYGVTILFLLILMLPIPTQNGYIADERAYYLNEKAGSNPLPEDTSRWSIRGEAYGDLQRCLNYEPFWITNSQYGARCMKGVGLGHFGLSAGSKVLILDEQGLPDREIARAPIVTRFRPGHEHYLTLDQVITKGVLFCSTGESAYDRTMKTPAGILINLDPDILSTVPGIQERLKTLLELKKQGSPIVGQLEKRWKVSIESLLADSEGWKTDALQSEKNRCWNEFPASENGFFY